MKYVGLHGKPGACVSARCVRWCWRLCQPSDAEDGLALQAIVAAWEQSCGPLDQYGMQHSRTFANLCNAGVPIQTFARTVAAECTLAVPTS